MGTILLDSLRVWWPETILSLGALVVVLLGVFSKKQGTALIAVWLTLLASAIALWRGSGLADTRAFFGLILCDRFSLAFRWMSLGLTVMVALLMTGSREIKLSMRSEFFAILIMFCVGLMLMAEATHLLMAYLAMELVSLSSYMLVGFSNDKRAAEASLKYLLFGALSSGVMLFGMSLIFGLTQELAFSDIGAAVAALAPSAQKAVGITAVLMLAGLGFKISMVPFHMWTPDAYEGAVVPVAALLSVGPKAAGLAMLLRIMEAFSPAWHSFEFLLIVLVVLTMTLGNLVALVQTNVKRLLAYSTI